jgi:hypothetical protein
MSVKFDEPESTPVANAQDLPNLLSFGRHRRPCKSAHGNRKLNPESKSTGGFHGSLERQMSIESSKSLGVVDRASMDLDIASEERRESTCSDPGPRVFPLKAEPLKRWRAAAKIQGYLDKWRKGKKNAASSTQPETTKVEIGQHLQSWVQHWPDEPQAPTTEDLIRLTELESMLVEHHGTIAAAYKFIINCVKNPGNAECNMTKRELRIALHLKASKEGMLPSSPGGDVLDQMFDKLLALIRKTGGEISKVEFLRFPELLNREKALQNSLAASDEDLLLGSTLRDHLAGRISSPEEARKLLNKALVALQLEPCRTTNLLFQLGNAPQGSSISTGLTSAIGNIIRIARQFGAPNSGVALDVLVASWTLCKALAKQVVALGAPLPSSPEPSKNQKLAKPSVSSKGKLRSKSVAFGRKYQCKVESSGLAQTVQPLHDNSEECKAAFWQALSTDEVLWSVGCGAEVLNDDSFKTLLRAAWDLFDSFDAVGHLLGPVGWGRMRPKLDALAAVNLQQRDFDKDQFGNVCRSPVQSAAVLLQQVASMCEADPRMARIAALYGATFLADRICSTANSYVNFDDEAAGMAASQLNRTANGMTEALRLHVEELLGGRRVACCLSSGEFQIVPAMTAVANPLAEFHQEVTAAVLAKATPKRDTKKTSSQEFQRLKPVEKYLLGYSNLQGF